MNEYTTVYCDHTPLVSCPRCGAVLRAAERDLHDEWHGELGERFNTLLRLSRLFGIWVHRDR